MKGYVETPRGIVDLMVEMLFKKRPPKPTDRILDPGCGTGAFIDGIIRWCNRKKKQLPKIVGLELNPRLAAVSREKAKAHDSIEIATEDFLTYDAAGFDFVIGNPPYVPITDLSKEEKTRFRKRFATAVGRFDLYLLFLEKALQMLNPSGRLVFITPEKFLYVETAEPLRKLLSVKRVEEIRMVEEDVFGDLVTYPTITTIENLSSATKTAVVTRDGRSLKVQLPTDGGSWVSALNGASSRGSRYSLDDIATRVSCGVATGADAVFVFRKDRLDSELRPFAFATISGRELRTEKEQFHPDHVMLVPYRKDGRLLDLQDLGSLAKYLSRPEIYERLKQRTCVARKPWWAFHENPPLQDILRPKIICKDITATPKFWVDRDGTIVPRHSVYYIVPKDASRIDELAKFLNSPATRRWLRAHCQRAANGFLRLQSRILKRLPVPSGLVAQAKLPGVSPAPRSSPVKAIEAFG